MFITVFIIPVTSMKKVCKRQAGAAQKNECLQDAAGSAKTDPEYLGS
jgi:hypothetical protein